MIERVMKGRNKRTLNVFSGHTHVGEYIRVSRNINCQVGEAKLFKTNSQKIYI
jgi:hypothetical protein